MRDDFAARFSRPAEEFRPHVMWFWNAPLDEVEIRRQVRGFRGAGILEFYIHPMYGFPVDYLSEEMLRAVGWAVDEARSLGMRFWIYDEYNWPSGAAGGYVIRDHPERRSLILVRRELPEGDAQPPHTPPTLGGQGGAEPGPVVARFEDADGRRVAYHEVPQEGVCPFAQWSPFCWNQEGYADLGDPETVAAFLALTGDAYQRRFGEDFGKTIAGVFTDEASYCLAGAYGKSEAPLAWTHGLVEHFRERFGYDIGERLDALLRDTGDARRVRVDYWRLMAERLEAAYYRQYSEWCARHNLHLTGHVSGEEFFRHALLFFGDFYRCIRWLSVPGIDSIFPRFNHMDHFMVAAKSGGSALRHLGRERLLSETYTGSGWEMTPAEMKTVFDKLALGGVNLLQYMGAYYSVAGMRKGLPGGYPPSHNFQSALWPFYGDFGDYVARLSQSLARSRSTARVALLYPLTSARAEWAGSAEDLARGKPGPVRFERLQQTFLGLTNALLDLGVDYDYLFEDVLDEAAVGDGVLETARARYELLVLPAATCLPPALAEKLCRFLEAGGRALFVNYLPEWAEEETAVVGRLASLLGRDPAAANVEVDAHLDNGGAAETRSLAGSAWIVSGECSRDRLAPLRDALGQAIPDRLRAVASLPPGVWATRREVEGAPLLFLFNLAAEPAVVNLPEDVNALLDPETGERYRHTGAVRLEPRQAMLATAAGGELPSYPEPPVCLRERILGEAEFRTLEPNLCAASWEVRDGDCWVPVMDHRFPAGRPVAPGETFELRWAVDRAEDMGPVELVVEDLGETFAVEVNGRAVEGFRPCRVWDWRNVLADITGYLCPDRNEVWLRSRTPEWEGPHGPPLAALRGDFAVRGAALRRPPARLAAGSWTGQGFPHYAGTAQYRWVLDLSLPPGPVFAEAEAVAEVGVLVVNGHRLPPRLWAPYRFEITGHVRAGRNEIILEVTNTSANLLGRTDPRSVGLPAVEGARDLRPSGLLTPLRLRW